jgi:hypothetical protein
MRPVETALLLGEEHTAYGELGFRALGAGRTACAISPGLRPTAASSVAKFDPNEDALLAMDAGDRVLLAVADAHHGRLSSHDLLRSLAERLSPDLPNLHALTEALAAQVETGDPGSLSETTLAVVVYDRRARRGFGLSFGDSSVLLVGGGEEPRRLAEKRHVFVTPLRPQSLARERAMPFRFLGRSGGLLVAFTDGVDECCYRQPERSIRRAHLDRLFGTHGADAEAYARALGRLALEGVDGHPGGEDNLALAVAVL